MVCARELADDIMIAQTISARGIDAFILRYFQLLV
jgi:hypothetical protein